MAGFRIDESTLVGYEGEEREVIIPDCVKAIDGYAFSGNKRIRRVVIPDSVETIGCRAFSGCTGLIDVSFGAGVKTMHQYVFAGCIALEEISFPGTVSAVNYGTFKGCFSLKRVVIEEGVRRISQGAFCKCYALEEIILPSTIRRIRPYAFSRCIRLKKLVLKSSETDISNRALYKCPEDLVICWENKSAFGNVASQGFDVDKDGTLVSYFGTAPVVEVPSCVNRIGCFAFSERNDIVSVSLLDTVRVIESHAFAYTHNLESIAMPCVKRIGDGAFWAALGLKEVRFPETLTEAGDDILGNCWNLKKITFASKHVSFKGRIAPMCNKLEEVILPLHQDSIPLLAFYYCDSLRTVFIPDTVKHIGVDAFIGCENYEGIRSSPAP